MPGAAWRWVRPGCFAGGTHTGARFSSSPGSLEGGGLVTRSVPVLPSRGAQRLHLGARSQREQMEIAARSQLRRGHAAVCAGSCEEAGLYIEADGWMMRRAHASPKCQQPPRLTPSRNVRVPDTSPSPGQAQIPHPSQKSGCRVGRGTGEAGTPSASITFHASLCVDLVPAAGRGWRHPRLPAPCGGGTALLKGKRLLNGIERSHGSCCKEDEKPQRRQRMWWARRFGCRPPSPSPRN